MYQQRNSIFKSIPPVTLNLIIINAILWLAQLALAKNGIVLSDYLGLHYFQSELFYPHQIITYMFMHSIDFTHVLFNMFAVFMFGRVLESVWGSKRFLTYYILTGIGAGLINLLVTYLRIQSVESGLSPEMINEVYANGYSILSEGKNYVEPAMGSLNVLINTGMVGASGAVFGILVAFGMLFPNVELMMLFLPVPIKAKYFVIGYGVMELLLGVWNKAGDNVAHFAHLGGLIVGFILVWYWRKTKKINGRYY